MRAFLRNIFLPFVAWLALALIIWFLGPLFVFASWAPLEHPVSRIVLFSVLFGLWVLRKVSRYFAVRRANVELVEQVAQVDESELRSQEEVALLKDKLQEALGVLKDTKFGGKDQQRQLYELPWYMIIGPPGAGKTTALVNSGLNFPLAEKFGHDALKGVGGTRHCDWWFTDEAVMIDTAGRYTTQDSNQQQDAAAWTGFLSLLKKYRKRRPINGALVALSVSELLGQSASEREKHARLIRQRIQELQTELGIRFPVYVILTKCDLLAGFSEFFDDLRKDQREQVWGITFDLRDDPEYNPVREEFSPQFQALEDRLNEHLLERLEYERAPQRRDLIYAFPQQITALRGLLEKFLGDVFGPSRYEDNALLRGVYLTSATQEGNPIDRVLSSVAASFGIGAAVQPAFAGRGRSYFLTRLMREVVFAESGLAGTNMKEERRRAWLQRAAYAACLVALVGGVALWLLSYQRNIGLMQEIATSVEQSDQELRTLIGQRQSYRSTLPSLSAVQNIPRGYGQRDDEIPMSMRLGLHQGHKLGGAAQTTYYRLLHNLMLPKMIYQVEDALRRSENREWLYETLKVYLMLDDPERYDAQSVEAWFQFDWELNPLGGIEPAEILELQDHLNALANNLQDPLPIALDEDLIEKARRELSRMPMAERILGKLKLEARSSNKAPDFRIDQAAGAGADILFVRRSGKPLNSGLPGLYTYDGYKKVLVPEARRIAAMLMAEQWVMGEVEGLEDAIELTRKVDEIVDEVRALYFEEYVVEWDRMLADIQVAPFSGLQEAAEILNEASRASSPIRKLLQAVAKETQLGLESGAEKALRQAATNRLNRAKDRLMSAASGGSSRGDRIDLSRDEGPGTPVDEHFAELNELVEGESNQPLDRVINLLEDVYIYTDELASGERPSGTNPATRLRGEARRQPQPLRGWLEAFVTQANRTVGGGASQQLTQRWQSEVVPSCTQLVGQRFPFTSQSRQETGLREFGRVFGFGGTIDRFFQDNLAQYADMSSSPWRWRPARPGAPRLSSHSIRAFEQARRIRDTYFQEGGLNPVVRFDVAPSDLDQNITTVTLNIEGQRIVYRHGPVKTTSVRWPGQSDGGRALIQVNPAPPSGRSSIRLEGPWAWFRLLEQANISGGQDGGTFTAQFDFGGRRAAFRVRADANTNPFVLNTLSGFSCPGSL